MESLLSAILLVLIIILLLVVFTPAWLERQARRNRALRLEYAGELDALERGARQMRRALIPYERGHSAHFRQSAKAIHDQLTALDARLHAIGAELDGMTAPEIYSYTLAVQHFLLAPGDVGAILRDRGRVGLVRRALAAATADAATAAATVEGLSGLPAQLAAKREALGLRLAAVDTALRAERAAGIEALDDLVNDAARWQRTLGQATVGAAGETLAALDEGARKLEATTTGMEALETRVAALTAGRVRAQERLRQAATDLDRAQVTTKAGPAAEPPAQVRPLLRRAAALLNESAPVHLRRADFPAAEGDATAAARLVSLSSDLVAADRGTRRLAGRDAAGLGAEIGRLQRDLAEMLVAVDEAEPGAAREAALAARAAELRRRTEALVARQDQALAVMAHDARVLRDRLAQAWENSQQQLRLANDDPLTRRYERLAATFDEAQRASAALNAFRLELEEFERVLAPWVGRVGTVRQLVARYRARLPGLIDEALEAATPWQSLAGHVAFIQQRAADFERAQSRFAAVHQRREAEALMDELEAIEREVGERFAALNEQAERLRFLEADVDQIVTLSASSDDGLPLDDPARVRRDRAFNLIAHHTAQAHAAALYEDAALALMRAADLANKMGL